MPTISRRLASAGTADPGDLKSPSLPGASPGSPTGVWLIGNSRPVRLKTEQPWECKSPHADQFGMSTGRASRASVLTSACLRASGASPRHSAILVDRGFHESNAVEPGSGRFHKPAVSGAAPETARHQHAGHLASMQQPEDFFCKEFLPGQLRLEDPFHLLA